MSDKIKSPLTRRNFIKGATLLSTAALAPTFIKPARAAKTLKVGTYGGYFEESFVKI